VAHGLLSRPTDDVDLFTNADGGVRAATKLLQDAFRAAGYDIALVDDPTDLADLFEGFDDTFVEFDIQRDDRLVRMSIAQLDRRHAPVTLDVGPVMHLDDLMGSKMCALATRAQVRDYVDVAAALDRYTRTRLLELALARDPSLTDEDFAAASRLDSIPDAVFSRYDLTTPDVARLRERFGDWPRR
jgi:nucleotidyltransferase AbiEii toxin of type IV toxin-antitoxin system